MTVARSAVPRWLGLLPMGFAGYAFASYEQPWNILWLCNLSNVLLGLGLIVRSPRAIRLATLWLLLGAPLWTWDLWVRGGLYPHSMLTHLVAPCLGVWATSRGPLLGNTWHFAMAFGIAVQAICRVFTPRALNINASHVPYEGVDGIFASYPVYWVVNVMVISAVLMVVDRALSSFASAAAQNI